MTHESMEFDVVIVGAGPSGLSAAIQYAKLCQQNNKEVSVCVLEKGSEVGAHILSGAVIEPRALDELIPNWKQEGAPLETQVTGDQFKWFTPTKSRALPVPKQMNNHGNYIISLGLLCRWLAMIAESMGIDVYPGFAASQTILENNRVVGVLTGDMGIDKNGEKKSSYQPGMALKAKQLILAEGCRGSLTEQIIKQFNLRASCQMQTYGIGLKEIWQVNQEKHQKGQVIHTIGWPLDPKTYGGSFIYHWGENLVSIGFVIGLDYQNPYLDPYQEFQQYKTHPFIKNILAGGECLSYGARAINEGGWQSIPNLSFPGGLLVGCGAGFLNVPKIKGTHTAMKSGMLAAEAIFEALSKEDYPQEIQSFTKTVKQSWIGHELKKVRNIRPAFHRTLKWGMLLSAADTYIFMGYAPWTFKHRYDNQSLKLAKNCRKKTYPKPDGKLTFDKMTSISRSHVHHEEDQVSHLKLKDPNIPCDFNLKKYDGPEARFCPAGVYEFVADGSTTRLQINAQNCIHCKTCDIKDFKQNIIWTTPEGGGGPNYGQM